MEFLPVPETSVKLLELIELARRDIAAFGSCALRLDPSTGDVSHVPLLALKPVP
jgi:hypothetical protein